MSGYNSYKIQKEIDSLYLSFWKHNADIKKLEAEIKKDPLATSKNKSLQEEIDEHIGHCKRLAKKIEEKEKLL